MSNQQIKALLAAIRDALAHDCTDMAAGLTSLGSLMAEDPTPELWARIEAHGGFRLAA